MSTNRSIIVHYHLFKNAGTSVDQLLKMNFGEQWLAYDGDGANTIIPAEQLQQLVLDNPDKQAFSSHQIVPPLPTLDMKVFPIVFVRDPIDRMRSAYLFEWKKQLGLDNPKGTFEEYIKSKFKNSRMNSVEEFQTLRLSNSYTDRFHNIHKSEDGELLEQAKAFISTLEFVGIVDQFDRSMMLLQNYLKADFPDFRIKEVKANVLQDISLSQEHKREKIREELSADIYEQIIERNQLDEALYQFAKTRFEKLYSVADIASSSRAA